MEYHRTHDLLHVKKLLGHKNINSTMVYVNLEQAVFANTNDEFHVGTTPICLNLTRKKTGISFITFLEAGL